MVPDPMSISQQTFSPKNYPDMQLNDVNMVSSPDGEMQMLSPKVQLVPMLTKANGPRQLSVKKRWVKSRGKSPSREDMAKTKAIKSQIAEARKMGLVE